MENLDNVFWSSADLSQSVSSSLPSDVIDLRASIIRALNSSAKDDPDLFIWQSIVKSFYELNHADYKTSALFKPEAKQFDFGGFVNEMFSKAYSPAMLAADLSRLGFDKEASGLNNLISKTTATDIHAPNTGKELGKPEDTVASAIKAAKDSGNLVDFTSCQKVSLKGLLNIYRSDIWRGLLFPKSGVAAQSNNTNPEVDTKQRLVSLDSDVKRFLPSFSLIFHLSTFDPGIKIHRFFLWRL
jgi:hypothetical protein